MESEKEFKDELKQAMPIYKIAGIVIGVLLMFGVIFAIVSERGEPKPKPVAQEIPKPEPTPILNITQNVTENVTLNISNATINITQNLTNVSNVTIIPVPIPQPSLAVNLTWEGVTVTFPDSLKRITHTAISHHYVDVKEADGTPMTNGEQFKLLFNFKDNYGRNTELMPTFENSKWLISTLIPNPGNYTLILNIECADKQGHCLRRYPPGSVQKTMDFEVI